MSDPFLIEGPAIIAFSGGRTSGLMLYRIIEAHGGKLPADVVPVFCNTGKEHERTLDFVKECGERWGVKIRWIEWADHPEPSMRWREVDHATASREGEPFEAVIRRKNYLPNPVTRFCTIEMKIHATHRFVRNELHWDNGYGKAVGLRADERHRVVRARGREEAGGDPWLLLFPLHEAGATVADVKKFWSEQPFDLKLPLAADGTTPMGNCDLCYLKRAGKIASIIAMEPERAKWWIRMEQLIAPVTRTVTQYDLEDNEIGTTTIQANAYFRNDRPSYAAMLAQGTMFTDSEEQIDCACTD